MVKKFLGIIVICLLVAGAAYVVHRRSLTLSLESGETTSPDHTAPASGAAHSTPAVARSPQPIARAVPPTDTIPPNPPNGMIFSGAGPFQLYRQGNLTWRVDTGSGKSCILFATDTEWRKPRVYEQGCATS